MKHKYHLLILIIISITSCNHQDNLKNISKTNNVDTIVKHDTIYLKNKYDWQENFGLTHDPDIDSIWGKPIRFYTDNKNCSPIAIDFYRGEFRPGDNNITASLLSLVATNDKNLRPFYRWCLNKTIQIQDGALAEYTGEPARTYAEKFPREFFEYMNSDTTGKKYNEWVASINYSGLNGRNYQAKEDRKRFIQAMNSHCYECDEALIQRIVKFANDCTEK